MADRAVDPPPVTVPASWRLRSILAALLAVLAVSAGLPVGGPAQAAPAVNHTNPVVNQRADPHIVRHSDGYYYLTAFTPVRLRAHDLTDSYIRHYDYRARVEPNVTNLADSQFRIVPGLAGAGTVSWESANFPGYFLRHRGFALYVERDDGSTLFDSDASFHRQGGLADSAGLSLESQNYPGRYVRHRDGLLYLETVTSNTDRASATFHLE
ncbi:AbfB domain-containing protein [Micromonospora sp. WMMD998]|uniref:AbfB domain-containing protein n=1 Tax=Micromonospora sp. WMMD998 TaxID=3016092 RepID=UPI00249C5E48|nr:AbfB domain-containing protein [Micromonospora sp. WMMD998]WFE41166.1 AbfB domain-containing protein [Micromonospora sp. WMMD998]